MKLSTLPRLAGSMEEWNENGFRGHMVLAYKIRQKPKSRNKCKQEKRHTAQEAQTIHQAKRATNTNTYMYMYIIKRVYMYVYVLKQ